MQSHHRGRSLSEALTLEQSEDGALFVSGINNSSSSSQDLREGDEVLGATINFDQLSKEEVLQVLKLMEPFDDKIEVVTRKKRSKSIGNLDQYTRSPETMLKDSYNKFYNAKIRRFMRNGEESSVDKDITAQPTAPAPSRVNPNHYGELPCLGVDFGVKTKTFSTDVNGVSQVHDTGELSYGTNLNLPPLCLSRAQVPRKKVNVRSPEHDTPDFHPSANLQEVSNVNSTTGEQLPNTDHPVGDSSMPNLDITQNGLKVTEGFSAPIVGLNSKGPRVSIPDMEINPDRTMPKFNLSNLGLSGSSFSGPESRVKTRDEAIADVPSGKLKMNFPKRLKTPDLNVDDLSSFVGSPLVSLSGKSSDEKKPGINVLQPDLSGLDIDIPTEDVKVQFKKSENDLKSTDLDVDTPSGKLTWPNLMVTGKNEAHVETPETSLKKIKSKKVMSAPDIILPNLATGTPFVDNKSQSAKYKAPKFRMPKFDLPHIQDLDVNGDFVGADMQLAAPSMKSGITDHNFNLPGIDLKEPALHPNTQDVDFHIPSGKVAFHGDGISSKHKLKNIKMFGTLPMKKDVGEGMQSPQFTLKSPTMDGMDVPDFSVPKMDLKGLAGQKQNGLEGELKTPDFRTSPSKVKGTIRSPDLRLPQMDLYKPRLDLSGHNTTDLHLEAQSSQFQVSKYDLSGALQKGPNLDFNTDLQSPDLTLKAPKIKGEIETPNLEVPKMDLNIPKLDGNTPKVDIGSPKSKIKMPKLKMSKFGFPRSKGASVNSGFDGLDMNVNVPNVNFKGSNSVSEFPDANVAGPEGKFKIPDITLPDMGLSGPKLGGPNLDLKLTSHDTIGLNAPDMDMPKIELENPKLDFNTPEFNIKKPSGILMRPEHHIPNWDVNSHLGELKKPQFNLSATLPKGNLDLNSDLKSPDLTLKAPKIKSGIEAPNFDVPKMDLKAPKLGVNAPKANIGSPNSKLKMPKLKMPKFAFPVLKGPAINGSFDDLDMNVDSPNVNFKGSKVDFDIPDANVAGPRGKIKVPNITLPDVEFSRPKFSSPNLDVNSPSLEIGGPNLSGGLNSPDIDMPKVDLKNSKLDFSTPDLDNKMASGKMIMPELYSPKLDVNAPSGKLKMPKFNLSGTLPKEPKLPEFALSAPKIKGGIEASDLDLPKIDLKSPRLDVNASQVNIGSPKSKLKMPKIKMPKFGHQSLIKGPEINGSIKGPDAGLKLADINLKVPKADLGTPDAGISSPSAKLRGKDFSLPDFGLSVPKLNDPNLNLKSSKLDISGPSVSGINAQNRAKVDLKSPKLNLNTPNLNIGMPSGKIDIPEVPTPDWKVKAPSGKVPKFNLSGTLPKGPDININPDMKAPDLSLKNPNIKGKIHAPDSYLPSTGLEPPKLAVNIPDVEIGSPKAKMKMPKFKMSKLGLPSLKKPAINGDLNGPNVELNTPTVNLGSPKPDFDIGGSLGKFKKPNFDMPDLGLSNSKLDWPDLDLKSTKTDLSAPKFSGKIKAPDTYIPKVDLKSPRIDFDASKIDLEMPRDNLNLPTLTNPNAELQSPHWDTKAPTGKLKFPKVNLSGTLPKGQNMEMNTDRNLADLSLKAPGIMDGTHKPGLDIPKFDHKSPKLDMNTPDVYFDSPDIVHSTNLNVPGHDFDMLHFGKSTADLKAPKLDMNTPDVTIGLPEASIKKQKIKMPKFSNVERNGDIHGMKFTAPQVKGEARGQDLMELSTKIQDAEYDLDFAERKFKLPSLKLPQFGGPSPNGSDIDFGTSMRSTNMDISPPNAKPIMKTPQLRSNVTGLNVSDPVIDLTSPKAAMPNSPLNFKNPDLNVDDSSLIYKSHKNSKPDITGMNMKIPALDVDEEVRLLNTDKKSSRTKVRSSYPQRNAHFGHHIDLNRSDLNVDDFTEKDHVLRARGSKLDLQPFGKDGQVGTSGVNMHMTDSRYIRGISTNDIDIHAKPQKTMQPNASMKNVSKDESERIPSGTDGYYVTVFPTQEQNQKVTKHKHYTIGRPGLHPANMELEVPGENDLKGSTYFLLQY